MVPIDLVSGPMHSSSAGRLMGSGLERMNPPQLSAAARGVQRQEAFPAPAFLAKYNDTLWIGDL
jgi:hypothetical protein